MAAAFVVPGRSRRRRLVALLLCAHEGRATVLSPSLIGRPPREKRDYFARISLSGALACSITHSLVVPLDVIKTRLQTDGSLRGVRQAARAILQETQGPFRARVFLNGVSATGLGYYLQGGAKFGGYELLKYNIFDRIDRAGGSEAVRRWRLPVMMGAAGVAEIFASVMLTPLEVTPPTATTTTAPGPDSDPDSAPDPDSDPDPETETETETETNLGGEAASADRPVRCGEGPRAHVRAHLARRGLRRALPGAEAHHDAPAAVHRDQARRLRALLHHAHRSVAPLRQRQGRRRRAARACATAGDGASLGHPGGCGRRCGLAARRRAAAWPEAPHPRARLPPHAPAHRPRGPPRGPPACSRAALSAREERTPAVWMSKNGCSIYGVALRCSYGACSPPT